MTSTLSEEKLKEYHDVAVDLVTQCGPIFMEGYHKTNKEVTVKTSFYDFVTVFDRRIEEKLFEGLSKSFPESRFIGEESLEGVKELPELTDAPTWIIDPIDGTTNYIHRLPHCGISVALAVNKELVVGIIYDPVGNELFTSMKGKGTFLNGKSIQVSSATTVCICYKNCMWWKLTRYLIYILSFQISSAVVGYEITLINVAAFRDKSLKRTYKLGSVAAG